MILAGVAVAAAAAIVPLLPVLDGMAVVFLADWSIVQQGASLVLLFCVIFGATVVTSTASLSSTAARSSHKNQKDPDYPLDQVRQLAGSASGALPTNDSDLAQFKCVFPMLKDEILDHLRSHCELNAESVDWVDRMVDYSVPGGKLNRGTTVLAVVRALLRKDALSPLETCRAAVLGWAIEFLQAFFLVADDVMDDSVTRRGQPCWYKLPHVGLIAINDAFLLESFVFTILRRHFAHEPYYAHVLELMIDVTQRTEVGQLLDLTSQVANTTTNNTKSTANPKMDLDRFTEDRYRSIVRYKTAYYSFYLPIAMGLHMAGVPADSPAYPQAIKICEAMGEYFQIQDDYLDCFGDPQVIGKIGTDIQDQKCSWLVVQALQRARGPADRVVLEQNYGVWGDDAKVERVKKLYRDLNLVQAFEEYEEASYQDICQQIDAVTLVPQEVYKLFLHKIYKRSK